MKRWLKFLAVSPLLFLSTGTCAESEDGDVDGGDMADAILSTDFKKCAAKVLKESTGVIEILEDCEAEMNAYIQSEVVGVRRTAWGQSLKVLFVERSALVGFTSSLRVNERPMR